MTPDLNYDYDINRKERAKTGEENKLDGKNVPLVCIIPGIPFRSSNNTIQYTIVVFSWLYHIPGTTYARAKTSRHI